MHRPLTAPRVSILLPCRDAAPYLPESIASLEAQTFSDFEVIAVDDGSSDGTAALLDNWAARDARVRVMHERPAGIVRALACALERARAPLVARMDADDVALPDRLAAQVRTLDARPDLAGCGTRVRYFPRHLVRDGARRYEEWLNAITTSDDVARDAFIECPIAHPTLLARRDAVLDAGGYRETDWPEDYDLVLRLLHTGHQLANVPATLHEWRERPDRLSRQDPRYSLDAFTRCKAHHLACRRLRDRPAVIVGAGPVGKRIARALLDEAVQVQSFVELDTRKIGQRIHGAGVIGYEDLAVADGDVRHRRPYFLAAVAGPGPRTAIRNALRERGLIEPEDFCAVA